LINISEDIPKNLFRSLTDVKFLHGLIQAPICC